MWWDEARLRVWGWRGVGQGVGLLGEWVGDNELEMSLMKLVFATSISIRKVMFFILRNLFPRENSFDQPNMNKF